MIINRIVDVSIAGVNFYYADWTGTKLYNGSVSAMTWTMGTDTKVRGYKYTYNGYGWLTSADYGEGTSLTTNKDRYTEKSTAFTENGGIKALQRHGLTAMGTYGMVDNLRMTYKGNRVAGITDAAPVVTQNGSMDYPGGTLTRGMAYNAFGALVSDAGRRITDISYDNSGDPLEISYGNGGSTQNVYSATGEKLKATHTVGISSASGSSLMKKTVAYHGPVVYSGSKVDMVLFPGGYATVEGGVTFHYYTQDYLGNNRAVINGSTGAVEQTVAYYPYGAVIADLGTAVTSGQPFKFGGKELIATNGINEYDFEARNYYPAVPGFTKPDPMAEKYTWLSPYLYCSNNPVNLVDLDGREWRAIISSSGYYVDFSWIESKDARDENGELLPYHYEQAILFTAEGKDGKTFDKESQFNMGSSTAVVYKADGTTEEFDACTYPSDVDKYATVPEGQYEAKVGKHKNTYAALRLSDIDTQNFSDNSIELGKPNPANPNTTKAKGINIHKPGLQNLTGMTRSKQAISQGCLLISRKQWNQFITIFDNANQRNNLIGVIVLRP
ncbi:MAG: hypothetical protein K2L11_03895 [Muribaculaceae bacterium]|nr:hypothetical protein [Muribaculaceae bacterium]